MPYVPGGDCDVGPAAVQKKGCDGCFPSKSGSPIVVKICRPINNVNRMGYGGRFPSNRGDCCKWCINKANANQMVANQNRIVNFDLINRINEANGMVPNLTYTSTPPGGPPGKRKCDNCINILRDKELQLLKKEQEILKIKTHFTKLPKGAAQDGLGTNCEHCFKALRQKEFELFRKEQEIAKMKMAAAARSPLNTQAKVDRARCANCFKALRQKELELLKKEHALMKNMTRPNINVKNLNYCSCCRDNKKSSINQMKKQEELRKKNRDNCFKQLRMKEIRLQAKEREIDKKIQKFREESLAKAKSDLDKTPDPRLIAPTTKEVIKCVCSCTGSPQYYKEKEKAKGICKFFYNKFPTATGGWRGQKVQSVKSQDTKLSSKALKQRTCARPCCAMKLATNLAACFLSPPKAKKPKELPEPCSFMRMLPWCAPEQNKNVVKCCIIPTKPEKELSPKEQRRFEERITKQKAMAIKAAKAASQSASQYRVDTIGQIRPGKIKPSSRAKLNAVESEVLRKYGPKGLEAYKTKMAELKIDTEVAQAKLPKRIESRQGRFETEGPSKYRSKMTKQLMSKMGIQGRGPKETKELYSSTRAGADREAEEPISKPLPGIPAKKPTFKTKVYDRATRAAKQFKTKGGPHYAATKMPEEHIEKGAPESAVAYGKAKGQRSSKSIVEDGRRGTGSKTILGLPGKEFSGETRLPRKSKEMIDVKRTGLPKEYKTKIEGERSKVSKKIRSKMDKHRVADIEVDIPKKDKKYARKADYERRLKDDYDYEERRQDKDKVPKRYKKFKGKDDYERELPKRYRTKVDDEDYDVPRGYGSRYGSGDYLDEWKGSSRERMRGPIPWFPEAPACPKYLKIFGQALVYCAGCFIGIPCILFLCLCFFMSSCSD